MESALWVINLLFLAFLCFWAVREDKNEQDKNAQDKKTPGRK